MVRHGWRTSGLVAALSLALISGGLFATARAEAATTVTISDSEFARCLANVLKKPASTKTFDAAALAGITSLSCDPDDGGKDTYDIRSISGAEYLTNTESFILYSGRVTDFTPLSGLAGLVSVAVNNNQLTDLSSLGSALAHSAQLKYLTLTGNQISDLKPLAGLTSVKQLNLFDNRIADPGPLAALSGLDQLDLSKNQITSLATLAGLQSLTSINLHRNSISDVTPLLTLTNLTNIELGRNRITDPSKLTALPHLQGLGLSGNGISDLSVISGFSKTGLTGLELSNNKISDVAPVAALTGLTGLDLGNNQISDVAPLARLTNLTQLSLGSSCDDTTECTGNLITDVRPLAGLTKLTQLDVARNPLSDVGPLANLANLRTLLLNGDRISDISPLARFTNPGGLDPAIFAEDQAPVLTVAIGAAVPLKGWKGKLPTIKAVPSGLQVIDGKLVATLAGTRSVSFSAWGADIGQNWRGTATIRVASSASVLTTLKIKLNKNAKRHTKKGKVALALTAVRGTKPTGKITIVDGTKAVATVTLSAANKGRRTVTLPKLRKGTHTLIVFYQGSATCKSAVTKVKVKVK
jgi:internalin A